jgi:hypothetical protein
MRNRRLRRSQRLIVFIALLIGTTSVAVGCDPATRAAAPERPSRTCASQLYRAVHATTLADGSGHTRPIGAGDIVRLLDHPLAGVDPLAATTNGVGTVSLSAFECVADAASVEWEPVSWEHITAHCWLAEPATMWVTGQRQSLTVFEAVYIVGVESVYTLYAKTDALGVGTLNASEGSAPVRVRCWKYQAA